MRIAIFGLPGSGKSTFAAHLAQRLALPLFHLDKYFFTADWQKVGDPIFTQRHEALIQQEQWIIDGNANATRYLEPRFQRADIIIFFKLPRLICTWRVLKRRFIKNRSLNDRAPDCPERVSWFLIKYLWTFTTKREARILQLLEQLPDKRIYHLTSDAQARQLLEKLSCFSVSNSITA
jgi:Adenylate kinase and related kinases